MHFNVAGSQISLPRAMSTDSISDRSKVHFN